MTELIEAVARALCKCEGASWGAASFLNTPAGESPEEMREGFRTSAQAALTAITDAGYRIVKDEVVAWLYSSPYGRELCKFRYATDEGRKPDDWVGWTERMLYAAAPGDEK
jgi:hypothetical protein